MQTHISIVEFKKAVNMIVNKRVSHMIVRCKECKFWHTPSCATYRILYDMENEREDEWMIDDAEGFCSYGERKG